METQAILIEHLLQSSKLYKKASGIKSATTVIAVYLLVFSALCILYNLLALEATDYFALLWLSPFYFFTVIMPFLFIPLGIGLLIFGYFQTEKLVKNGQAILKQHPHLYETIILDNAKLFRKNSTLYLAYDPVAQPLVDSITELLEHDETFEKQTHNDFLLNRTSTLQTYIDNYKKDYPFIGDVYVYINYAGTGGNMTMLNLDAPLVQDRFIPLTIPEFIPIVDAEKTK